MSRALDSELRNLGIPFFAIQDRLIRQSPPSLLAASSGADDKIGSTSSDPVSAVDSKYGEKKDSQFLTIEELTSFRRRILELLEDLCKE